jgi:addiction module HigA family antidote
MPNFRHTHPGLLLREFYLEPLGLSVTAIAKRLKVSRKHLSSLLNGRAGISAEMALKLSKALRTTPAFWMNLQKNYELSRAQKRVRQITRGVRELTVSHAAHQAA